MKLKKTYIFYISNFFKSFSVFLFFCVYYKNPHYTHR
jgi:hypothetical protein